MAIRNISIKTLTKPDTKVGPPPRLDFVSLEQLVIDENYQREITPRGWNNIQKIADNFDWNKFSPLMVSTRPDGGLAIIDGQHRAHAAALCGATHVPALISELTQQEQAAAFSWINGTVSALTPNQIFKAALAAFEPWAVQCDAAVSRAGCKLMPYNKNGSQKKPKEVFPITLVRRFVEAGHSEYLCAVLQGVIGSPVADDIRYYNQHGLSSLVPAAIETGVTRPEVIRDFLTEHNLSDTEVRVLRVMEAPEHRGKGFGAMFSKSVMVLLKDFAARRAASGHTS